MKFDVSDTFALELLLCIATSDVSFSEHNELISAANKLISYEFPKNMKISLDDAIKVAKAFRSKNWQLSEIFLKNFARKDAGMFAELARDQSKPFKQRIYRINDSFSNKVLEIARSQNINFSSPDIKELI